MPYKGQVIYHILKKAVSIRPTYICCFFVADQKPKLNRLAAIFFLNFFIFFWTPLHAS